MIDISPITKNNNALFLAYDQGLEHGPSDLNTINQDPNFILNLAVNGGYQAVIFQKGIAEKYYVGSPFEKKIPLIVKLNGKTNLVVDKEPFSPQICSVEEAISLGAQAVGYTLYVGSEYESRMFEEFGHIEEQAHEKGIPVIAWIYPRGKSVEGKDKKDLTIYAGRIGLEIGADIVKLHYPGDLESMKKVLASAGKTKVVVSGGDKVDEATFLSQAEIVKQSGALGMAVGRNVWQSENPDGISKKLYDIFFTQ